MATRAISVLGQMFMAVAALGIAGLMVWAVMTGTAKAGNVSPSVITLNLGGTKFDRGTECSASDGKIAICVRAHDELSTEAWDELWIVSPSGETARISQISSPASWASDASYCVASSSSGELVRIATGEQTTITPLGVHGLYPQVASDGKIAFLDGGRLKVLKSGKVTDLSTSFTGQAENWRWSADSRNLMFDTRMSGNLKHDSCRF